MQKNTLKSGLTLSELGLGCMSLGTNEKQAQEIVETALESGITYFDTADIYDKGENEKIVGHILKQYQQRDDIVIGTKVGNELKPNGEMAWNPTKKYIKENIKHSLQRLGLDQLDLYMLHGGTIDDPLDETISAFDELKQEGLVKAYGLSSIRPNVIRYYLAHSEIEVLMSQFNLIDNRPEMLLDEVHEHGVKLLARGPVFKGLLTQNYQKALTQKFKDGIFEYDAETLKKTVSQLHDLEPELTALTFNYLKSFDALGSIIVGASSSEQLKENVAQYNKAIDASMVEQARAIVKDLNYTQHLK
ncbi:MULTISPECIES: aldo/keto reductase [unclassified Staphylococcus]|uniref:aldo/keto reductase n=1 Tax=unclassified Staphylococcus TaxID=91994 RepID=UPI0021D1B58E|nr:MULTISPECIES: aldo/keto reductase [unclassified Staphylococcus]UXR68714.1 aldo/keto reductase [Staphylococcus sp. IVB6246]UXR70770.1 aldo/keto reductase [Staphylococcus sp. IVB6240]UXR73001.1 aldo/keto reductase [Staphylococcus sp. IVB6238]UXR75296.1 aldo/keto reductase [Staphylococcus sp. IVB6233]UXR79498.1 aldo/keto reductase [Staphylococcus sp. IVB6218]